ncbi:MAG: dihydroneopterin triphosphate diphosphatase [Gammaproteobacteria bacterium]|nr:dihydroneopterin triphosphate diphosphatase [Gammaproteobacteria bacterium]
MPNTFKRPESVLVLVYTAAGEVLMLRRRQPDDFWQSVTGSLEWDETPEQAARRELFEETGVTADAGLIDCHTTHHFPILPAWRARYAPDVTENVEHVFRIAFAARPAIRLDLAEHLEYRWLDRAAAADLATSHTNRDAIRAYVS